MSLPDPIHNDLTELAESRNQPIATVAAIIVELYLEQKKVIGQISGQQDSSVARKAS